ncbi:membrane hypothetical protein [uncultured Mycobacterium sp.]|uniref:O-antigen ligase-related domain-containing protein n=1 Tax=uncultured Mycobacterium sp. TaxID=171292 RepID=A0A1Y5PI89_9MYCO|nr:membrane hypothetical protein [uncultured Mycobacterium sp.]
MTTLPDLASASDVTDEVGNAPSAKWVRLFCSVAFLFFLGALNHVFGSEDEAGAGPLKALFLPIALLIQLIAIALLVSPSHLHKTLDALRRNRILLLALGVILMSTFWSNDPELTLRRALALVGTTAVGILIYIDAGDILKFFGVNLALFVVGSVFVALAFPALGTHTEGIHVGSWRGLLGFKNQAAWVTVLFLIVWIGMRKRAGLRAVTYPLLAVAFLLLFNTRSATGFAAFAAGIAALCGLSFYRQAHAVRPLLLVAFGIFALLIAADFDALYTQGLETLGRDDSLTGRTLLWTALQPLIESRPWFGNGYLAFWDHASDYFGDSSWMGELVHAHNAYIDILLDVGVVGLITQLSFLLGICWKLLSKAARGDSIATTMLAVYVTLGVIGIAGEVFFRPNSGIWIMVVAFACYATNEKAPPFSAGSAKPVST